MGIVDYAATTCLALSGVALAAPFLEKKVPAVGGVAAQFIHYRKFVGIFGIIGGALGVVAIPLLLLLVVGFGDLFASLPVLFVAGLELVGCVATIALGVMVLRTPKVAEPHSGEIDMPTIAGLGGVVYGGVLMMLISVLQALN